MKLTPTLACLTTAALAVMGVTGFSQSAAATEPPIVPGHSAYPAGGNSSIGIGTDAANQNAQLSDSVPATLAASWTNEPSTCPGSAGPDAASISVSGAYTVVDDEEYQCSFVSAYDTTTGALKWRHDYTLARNAVVSGSFVYVVHDQSSSYVIDALNLATGTVAWSKPAGAINGFYLSVGSGLVINNAVALNSATGATAFTLKTGLTGSPLGTPLIAGGTIYYNSAVGAVQAYSATTGAKLWSYAKPGGVNSYAAGSGLAAPSLHNGLLYVTSTGQQAESTTLVLNPSTGKLVRTLPRSDSPIAFDGNTGIFVNNDPLEVKPAVVSAVDLTTGYVYWTHLLPMNETTPWDVNANSLLIENGLVWMNIASDSGSTAEMLALSEVTGQQQSDTVEPCETGTGNLVVAEHRVFSSSGCGVQTYVPSSTPPAPVRAQGEMLSDPGFESGTSGWTVDTSGSLTRVTSPVRTGKYALKVVATSSTAGKVGIQQPSLLTNLTRLSYYSESCWIMPTAPGLTVIAAMNEYSPAGKLVYSAGNSGPGTPLDAGTWTRLTVSGGVTSASGDKLIPEFYSTTETTKTGSLIFDDCSVTPVYVAPPSGPVVSPPSAPQSVTAVAGDKSATVSFFPPASDGGGAITYYTAVASPSGLAASGSGSPLTITGLKNGSKYTFTVRANNSAGTGLTSAPSAPVTPSPSVTPTTPVAPRTKSFPPVASPGLQCALGESPAGSKRVSACWV